MILVFILLVSSIWLRVFIGLIGFVWLLIVITSLWLSSGRSSGKLGWSVLCLLLLLLRLLLWLLVRLLFLLLLLLLFCCQPDIDSSPQIFAEILDQIAHGGRASPVGRRAGACVNVLHEVAQAAEAARALPAREQFVRRHAAGLVELPGQVFDVLDGCSLGAVAGLEVVEDGGQRGEGSTAEEAIGTVWTVDCDCVL